MRSEGTRKRISNFQGCKQKQFKPRGLPTGSGPALPFREVKKSQNSPSIALQGKLQARKALKKASTQFTWAQRAESERKPESGRHEELVSAAAGAHPAGPPAGPRKGMVPEKAGVGGGAASAPCSSPKGLAHSRRGAGTAEPKVVAVGEARLQAFPLPQPPPLGERARGRTPDPARRGGGAQAGRVALGRGPPGRERAHTAGRTAAAGTAPLTFTAVGVAPEAMSARSGGCGGGFQGPSSRGGWNGSAGLSSAESRGRPGSSSSSPGQLDWLLAWDRPRHPLPQFEVPASRPFCRPFRFSVVSLSTPVLSNGFTTGLITETVG